LLAAEYGLRSHVAQQTGFNRSAEATRLIVPVEKVASLSF